MKKVITILILSFLALIPYSSGIIGTTFAVNDTSSENPADYFLCGGGFNTDTTKICTTFTNTTAWTTSAVGTGTIQTSAFEFNVTSPDGGTNGGYLISTTKNITTGMACDWQEWVNSSGNINAAAGADADSTFDNGNNPQLARVGGVNGNKHVLYYTPDVWTQTTTFQRPIGEWYNVTVVFNSTTTHEVYFNNSDSLYTKQTLGSFTFPFYFVFTATGASGNVVKQGIRNIMCYNATTGAPQSGVIPATDTTPPGITFYNMTSEGGEGCTTWNTNKNNACVTSDTTPTVVVTTNESASCAIGVSNLNYSDLGSGRDCSGISTQHTCTLTSQDELAYETSLVYIGCRDVSNNSNSTSTSGALAINITGLDTIAGNAIELGVRNSLSSSYTIYTNQRIYARNSADSQSTGRFDKVVKKLNKIWAFNRIGVSDSFVNMFNITPVLYTLEIANKTSAQITNQTELLLNATR